MKKEADDMVHIVIDDKILKQKRKQKIIKSKQRSDTAHLFVSCIPNAKKRREKTIKKKGKKRKEDGRFRVEQMDV